MMKNGRWFLQTSSIFLFLFSLAGLWACAETETSDVSNNSSTSAAPEGFVQIEAGIFTMGSPAGELGHWTNEMQHQVTLTRSF